MKLLRRFNEFRWTRPFWGGLYMMVGGAIMAWLPLGPITEIIRLGVGGIGGYICAILLIAMGLTVWIQPALRRAAGVVAVIVSLISFPVTNLGGFIIGMILGIVGGCMVFGWTPGPRDIEAATTPEPKPVTDGVTT